MFFLFFFGLLCLFFHERVNALTHWAQWRQLWIQRYKLVQFWCLLTKLMHFKICILCITILRLCQQQKFFFFFFCFKCKKKFYLLLSKQWIGFQLILEVESYYSLFFFVWLIILTPHFHMFIYRRGIFLSIHVFFWIFVCIKPC